MTKYKERIQKLLDKTLDNIESRVGRGECAMKELDAFHTLLIIREKLNIKNKRK